jgi:transposase-like protein
MTKSTIRAADLLVEVGRALHGEEWVAPLARDLGVSAHTLRAWKSGKLALSADHGVMRDALRLLQQRRDSAARIATRLERYIAGA